MAGTNAPERMVAAAGRAREGLRAALAAVSAEGSVTDWVAVLEELQGVVDVASAAQDAAMVQLAAVEHEWAEDGTVAEVRRAPGHVALDAPAVVSGALRLSAVQGERRVRHALRLASEEWGAEPTGLGGLHAAMAEGRLDAYRSTVVAHELEEAPAEVAACVVAGLEPWFATEDASRLRRRCRRMLVRISPDLLRQRAVRARSESSLRRWVDEPGVDTWLGTFPSEEACTAWAAIDELAQRYVADGTCDRIDRARARALTDLVTANATIDVRVTLVATVGDAEPDEKSGSGAADLVPVSGAAPGDPVLVERGWLARAVAATTCRADRRGRVVAACDPATGALVDADDSLPTDGYRPGARLARFVRERDGQCRFPGCHVAARFCDLDHVVAWPVGPTSAANLVCLCRRHHRVKQRAGWRSRLSPDGTLTWTDPTGRMLATTARDQRGAALPDRGADRPPPATHHSPVLPDAPHSVLEHHLEHRPSPRPWVLEYRPSHGHRSRTRRTTSPPGDPPF